MSVDPAARAICKDFRMALLRRFFVTHRQIELRREFIALISSTRGGVPLAARGSSGRKNDCKNFRSVAVILLERS
jgi:hypothetical protein